MIDISILKQYTKSPDDFMIRFIEHSINQSGLISCIEHRFKSLVCNRVFEDMRIMQTTSYRYINDMTELIYMIENFIEDKDEYYERLIKLHNENIEFEKLNPPINYGDDNIKVNKSKTKSKSKPKNQEPKEPKEPKISAAERKLAAKAARLNSLSINIKPVN